MKRLGTSPAVQVCHRVARVWCISYVALQTYTVSCLRSPGSASCGISCNQNFVWMLFPSQRWGCGLADFTIAGGHNSTPVDVADFTNAGGHDPTPVDVADFTNAGRPQFDSSRRGKKVL